MCVHFPVPRPCNFGALSRQNVIERLRDLGNADSQAERLVPAYYVEDVKRLSVDQPENISDLSEVIRLVFFNFC